MVNLRRRKRRRPSPDPTGDDLAQDLGAVTDRIVETATARLGRPVEVAVGPEPVVGGHGSDVYRFRLAPGDEAWTGDRDLLARWAAPEVLAHEVAWMDAVAAAGFPTPERLAHAPEHELLVLRAPAGKSLTECMLTDMSRVNHLLGDMGRLHTRLHALPAAGVAEDARARGATTIDSHEALADRAGNGTVRATLTDELAWLDRHAPDPVHGRSVVCHGELHSSHVYVDLDGDGPASTEVVNWSVARVADPELDVAYAMTAFWFAPYYLDNPMYRKVMKMARESLASAYLDGYRPDAPVPLDDERLRYWQAFHLGSLATDLAHRVHHGPRHRWDPMGGIVNPDRTLDELRERFWDLTRDVGTSGP